MMESFENQVAYFESLTGIEKDVDVRLQIADLIDQSKQAQERTEQEALGESLNDKREYNRWQRILMRGRREQKEVESELKEVEANIDEI